MKSVLYGDRKNNLCVDAVFVLARYVLCLYSSYLRVFKGNLNTTRIWRKCIKWTYE